MRKITFNKVVIVCIFLAFLTGFSIITWKMFQFKGRLYDIIDNRRWESTLFVDKIGEDNLIVFFGDSQISLWHIAPSFGVLPILNRGIWGDLALKATQRFDKDVLRLKPKSLVLLIGTNDLRKGQPLDSIIDNIDIMLWRAMNNNVKVILCSLLPVRNQYVSSNPPKDIVLINSKLSDLAQKYKIDYADFHSVIVDENGLFRSDCTNDGLHPNDEGYMRMSKILFPYLVKNLKFCR